jgi:Exonuclease VII small subunit
MAKKKDGNFEENMQRLQEIVQELERAELSLEKNVTLYKEGRALVASCKGMLDKARHEINLSDGEEGDTPFSLSQDENI